MTSHRTLALLLASLPLYGAAVSHDELVTGLEAKFPPNKTGTNATVFVLQRDGAIGYPPATLMLPESRVIDGNIGQSRLLGGMVQGSAPLAAGTRVFVTKIESKNEWVKFHVSTMDKFDTEVVGVATQKRLNAVLAFKFAKDFLNSATAAQVAPQIAAILGPDTGGPAGPTDSGGGPPPPAPPPPPQDTQKSFDAVPPPPPPPDAAPAAPQAPATSIAMGQTTAQVVAALGQPKKINNLAGKKQEYVYSDLKVTFTNGKVTDVQ